jgi:hypothetical protein
VRTKRIVPLNNAILRRVSDKICVKLCELLEKVKEMNEDGNGKINVEKQVRMLNSENLYVLLKPSESTFLRPQSEAAQTYLQQMAVLHHCLMSFCEWGVFMP